jgi:hypothetical protein
MTKAHRTLLRTGQAGLCAGLALLLAPSLWAQPQEAPAEPPQAQNLPPAPAEATVLPPVPAAAATEGAAPAEPPRPPTRLRPRRPPGYAQPGAYPSEQAERPGLAEWEGPVSSWDPQRFAVAFELRTSWLFDDAAKRLAGGRELSYQGFSAQADVFRPDAKLALRLDLAWYTSSASSLQNDTSLEETLKTNQLSLALALRYHIFQWLAPYARLGGGLGWDKLTVAGMTDRQRFTQGTAGVGLFLRTPGLRLWHGSFAPSFGLVGHIEAGYALATGSDFVLHASPPAASDKPIPAADVALGHTSRSAPYARASLGIAF